MGCLAAVARGYVRWPVLWLVVVGAVCTLLGWYVAAHGDLHLDTNVGSFVVRGTLLSNRRRSAAQVPKLLRRYPPEEWTMPPLPPLPPPVTLEPGTTPAPPTTPEPPTPLPPLPPTPEPTPEPPPPCSRKAEWFHWLVEDAEGVMRYDGLKRVCLAVEALLASEAWKGGCAGRVVDLQAEGRGCTVPHCDPPVWLGTLPDVVAKEGGGVVKQLIELARDSVKLLDGIELIKTFCTNTHTVPCTMRETFRCAGEEPREPPTIPWLQGGATAPVPAAYWANASFTLEPAFPVVPPVGNSSGGNHTFRPWAAAPPTPAPLAPEERLREDKAKYKAMWDRYNTQYNRWCAAPCELELGYRGRVDFCQLLLSTNATAAELAAVAQMPLASPVSCAALTQEYASRLVSAMQVLVSWGKRSSVADRMLPYGGGRAFFTEASVQAAADRKVSLGKIGSDATRVLLHVGAPTHDALFTNIKTVAAAARTAATEQSLSMSWREWGYFEHEAQGQLVEDGKWAVGSMAFVLVYIICHAQDVWLGIGAVVGILLALPVSLFVYRFVLGLKWVGILHVTGLFFIAGVGADDFFVLLAHWKEALSRRAGAGAVGREGETAAVSWTMRHSFGTVTATSLTTAGAFLGNCMSDIAPIKLFGIYMAVLITSLLVVLGGWFPPLFVLTSRRASSCAACIAKPFRRPKYGEALRDSAGDGTDRELAEDVGPTQSYRVSGEVSPVDLAVPPQQSAHGFQSVSASEETGMETSMSGSPPILPGPKPLVAVAPLDDLGSPAVPMGSESDGSHAFSPLRTRDASVASPHFPLVDETRAMVDGGDTADAHPHAAAPFWPIDTLVVKVVQKYHRGIVLGAAVVVTICFFVALQLPGTDGNIVLWPAWHNQAQYFAAEKRMDVDVGRIDLRLTWGVQPADQGDLMDPSSRSGLKLDPSFDCTTKAAQLYFLKVCRALEAREGVLKEMVDPGSVQCPMQDLQHWLVANYNTSLPLSEADFLAAAKAWYSDKGEDGYANFYYHPSWTAGQKPYAMTAWVGTRAQWQQPWQRIEPHFNAWETWLKHTDPPPEAAHGFHSAGDGWTIMETQRELQRTAVVSLLASLGIALVILTFATRNLALASLSMVCIISAVTCLIAGMTVLGWNLGVVESVCITVVVGMSCDYVVHVASLYAHQPSTATPEERVAATLTLIGRAILGAAITSIGAAAFLLGCIMVFLSRFGMFVILTLALAFITAMYLLPSALLTAAACVDIDRCSWQWPACRLPCRKAPAPRDVDVVGDSSGTDD